jgi:membrane associated rhomboid family serine protease
MNTMLPPAATRYLILANAAVYFLQTDALIDRFALWPLGPNFSPEQLLTHAFLHNDLGHLFVNMFAVFMFGSALERAWGARRYLALFFASVLAGGASQLLVAHLTGSQEPSIGASGGVFGLLLAFGFYFPRVRLMLLFPPIPMPAWLFVTLYGALELFLGITNRDPQVAHFAHLGGMLGAALVILFWRGQGARPQHPI